MEEVVNKYKKLVDSQQLTVGVIGLGYVGLPLAAEFARKGFKTFGFDTDSNKIQMLNNGINYIQDLEDNLIKKVTSEGNLIATHNFEDLQKCHAIFICVPTPFTPNKDPDISYIVSASNSIKENLVDGQVIILKSTTFPGTTEKYVRPIIEKTGKIAGKDFYLAFSPERIDPGNKVWTTSNTPVVVGGIDELSTEIASLVHNVVVNQIKKVKSPAVAEMEKLLENIFRSVNIALVNELAQLCDRIGINIWEVVDAAATKPFGFMPFYPGPGIGGHCILIDPYYLAWMAREYDFVTKFIQLAAEINEDMPYYVKNMIIKEIAKQDVTIRTAKILILGMAFKRDVDDLRHSPALKVAELLFEEGIQFIDYHDPYIPEINVSGKKINSIKEINPSILSNYDIIVITTDHSVFDYGMIVQHSKVIVDTRNACKNYPEAKNVVLLGDGR